MRRRFGFTKPGSDGMTDESWMARTRWIGQAALWENFDTDKILPTNYNILSIITLAFGLYQNRAFGTWVPIARRSCHTVQVTSSNN